LLCTVGRVCVAGSRAPRLRPTLRVDASGLQDYACICIRSRSASWGRVGYAGRELCGLVAGHPQLALAFATADGGVASAGARAPAGAPADVTFVATDDARLDEAALVFSALPHGRPPRGSSAPAPPAPSVVDLSSDLRPGTSPPSCRHARRATRATRARRARALGQRGSGRASRRRASPYGLPSSSATRSAAPTSSPTRVLPTAILARPRAARGAGAARRGGDGERRGGERGERGGELAEGGDALRRGGRGLPRLRRRATSTAISPRCAPPSTGSAPTWTSCSRRTCSRGARDPGDDHRARDRAAPTTRSPRGASATPGEPFVEVVDAQPTLREVAHRNVVRLTAVPLPACARRRCSSPPRSTTW
jgi:N-acetyl-gamma-glutamyl-phosphate reductase